MLINMRNAMMAGKRLPYDAEVEYLESTGTQYIDTGIIGRTGVSAECRFYCTEAYSDESLLGSKGFSNNRCVLFALLAPDYVSTRGLSIAYATGNRNTDSLFSEWSPQVGSWYTASSKVARSFLELSVQDVRSWNKSPQTATINSGANMIMFAREWNGSISAFAKARIAYMKIWSDNVLVRDFIPVRKGNVGYLYDRVSGQLFGNQGTGDFVLGPDVVPVEWLGSDGNQYIDTGYVFQFGDDVSATFQPLATPTQTAYFFGADTSYNAGLNVHYDPGASGNGVRYCYGGGLGGSSSGVNMSPAQAFSTSTIYACNGNTNKRIINSGENTASVQDSGLNSASMILFCGRRNANVRTASTGFAVASRFYGFGATRNGAGIRAMKPVRVGTEGAMMDVLTRRIYRNAGTGAFTYGNDLKYPIPAE